MKRVLIFLQIIVFSALANACTIAVVSGKYTKDGRPLLWKNRDTWAVHNQIVYFEGEKYNFVGLANSTTNEIKSIWIGVNSAGFAIMNSASYNLNLGDTVKQSGFEGRIMKKALATCATVEDFRKLLEELPKPTHLEANFGVIDAQGGAALFEVGNYKIVMFDANDPKVAPFGYIIRGNYSFTGSFGQESSGYIRLNTVNELFYNAMATNSFDAQFIIQDVTRSLKHSLTKVDLYRDFLNIPANTPTYTFFHDFVPRRSSASACVVQGVKKGENPENAVMWSVVGFPLTSIAIPVWVKGGNDFPEILKMRDDLKDSPMCYAALTLKKQVFPIRWGKFAAKFYININVLVNADKTGILQIIRPYENEIFRRANENMKKWRENGLDKKELKKFYVWVNDYVSTLYKQKFGIEM